MKRTDPRVRKRCRDLYGDDWFATDKRRRQDDAIAYLMTTDPPTTTNERHVNAPVCDPSTERQDLEKAIGATLKGYRVDSITKVNNDSMRSCYDALKQHLNTQDERVWLFHGTTHVAFPNILEKGFNRSYCGRNATVYGRGVYFARDIQYSAQRTYSPPDETGIKVVIAARVLVGRAILGNAGMIEPGASFDTTVDSTASPAIFVVYKDFQALPEYVIRLRDQSLTEKK